MKIESKAKKVYKKIRKHDIWEYYQKEAKGLLEKDFSKLNNKQSHIVAVHSLLTQPPLPTEKETEIYDTYLNALHTKDECEAFYYSKRYSILTLGKGLSGKEVIKTIREKAGYKG